VGVRREGRGGRWGVERWTGGGADIGEERGWAVEWGHRGSGRSEALEGRRRGGEAYEDSSPSPLPPVLILLNLLILLLLYADITLRDTHAIVVMTMATPQ